ncbi:(deoxy)nucleoside triphosphate pyrophosphohydrolase [Francisellaceae bacterium CB300]|jgi:8-oxo-dGTP diphosphatase
MAQINASVAIILDDNQSKVYITQRQKHQSYSGYWEFPGGKVENNETFEQCVIREVYEEIGLLIENMRRFDTNHYVNNDGIEVLVEFFIANKLKDCGENIAIPKENQKLKLVEISELNKYKFLPGSLAAVTKLQSI